jgi:hypothetical protein
VQIGGGVRVGDAFQAIVGFKPIAIWVSEFRVEISQARSPHHDGFEQEKCAVATDRIESEARERGKMSGRSGMA